jgi:chromosome partitioning protein
LAKVISFINFKGGVGKTTLAVNIAACLAREFAKKVLLVDLDAQANASIWLLGAELWRSLAIRTAMNKTAFGLFSFKFDPHDVLIPLAESSAGNLDGFGLIPSSYHLIGLEDLVVRKKTAMRSDGYYVEGSEYRLLGRGIGPLLPAYDYVILDSPPNLYNVTRNGIYCSDYIVVPCIPDTLSMFGLKLLLYQINRLVKRAEAARGAVNPVVLGVVLNKKRPVVEHQHGTDEISSMVDQLRARPEFQCVDARTAVLDQYPVRDLIDHAKAVSAHKPLCLFAPTVDAYEDIKAVTKELLKAMEARE